jgi:hypothetical protein
MSALPPEVDTRKEQVMADGDKLTLGELGNSATSMTRLVGRVDDNFAFRVDQEGTGDTEQL